MESLNILYSNINSYNNKKRLINHYIQNNDISCTLFVETKTKNDSTIGYQNWNVIHHPGNIVNTNLRGGSLIQLHPRFQLIKTNAPSINNPLNDCIHVAIPFKNDQLHLFLVYFHPNSLIEETVFTKANLYKYSIIIGDFNINNSRKKRQLTRFLTTSGFNKYETEPTFIMPNNEDTTPDLILYSANLKNNIKRAEVIADLGADHLGIQLFFDMEAALTTYSYNHVKYKFQKCDIDQVNAQIGNSINKNPTINKAYISEFNSRLSDIILENTPKTSGGFHKYELPPFIIKQIKFKRKMYREYRMNKNPAIKRYINNLSKSIHAMVQQYNNHKWVQACEEINDSKGKKFYEKINKITKYKQRSTSIGTLVEGNKQFSTDSEKAGMLANYFKKAFTPEVSLQSDAETENSVNKWYDEYFGRNQKTTNIQINEEEYFETLAKQKNSAPGHDRIPWTIFKNLNTRIHQHIIKIYNFCISNSHIPQTWKTGHVVVIHKPNTDSKKASSYRPITLLPVIGKLFEKLIRKLMLAACSAQIPKFQYGFREKHSTTHPLIILTSNIETTRLEHKHTAALFLDINKAFDSVWHRGLLFKLAQMKIPDYLIHITRSFLENRVLKIKVNNTFSNTFTPLQGVPQGSPLSPVLYNLFCYDIFHRVNPNSYILQYADDTALIANGNNVAKTIQNLQQLIGKTEEWFHRWKMKPNPNKSQFIIFYHTPKPSSPTVKLADIHIKPTSVIKYLGLQIDQKLNFKNHFTIIKKRTIARAKYFRNLTYKNSGINSETAGTIYKAICRPLLEYAHPVFINCKRNVQKIIQTAETTALRSISKIRHPQNPIHNPPNQYLYHRTKTKPILNRIEKLNQKFAKNQHNLDILNQMCNSRLTNTSRYKHPQKTLLQQIHKLNEEE